MPPVTSKSRRRAYREIDRLSKQVTRDARTDMERVVAVVQHLRKSFAYELYHVDYLNPEGCVQLMNRGAGSCTHFASMAMMMLRRLNIPTRIAAGYVAREPLPGNETGWLVRRRNGHAWIEVHFDGIGWLPFDPTPGDATVGGALTGWSPLEAELEELDRRGRNGKSTTALAAITRAAVESLRGRGVSVAWLLLLPLVAGAYWLLNRGPAEPAFSGEERAPQVPVRAGGGSTDPALKALFDALGARGFIQPRSMTPRAFARSVEAAIPEAQGLEDTVLALLRAAAGRGDLRPQERDKMACLTDALREILPPEASM